MLTEGSAQLVFSDTPGAPVPSPFCLAHITSAPELGSPLPTSAPGGAGLTPARVCAGRGWAHPCAHLRRGRAYSSRICAAGDRAHPSCVCNGAGLGSPPQRLRAQAW